MWRYTRERTGAVSSSTDGEDRREIILMGVLLDACTAMDMRG